MVDNDKGYAVGVAGQRSVKKGIDKTAPESQTSNVHLVFTPEVGQITVRRED